MSFSQVLAHVSVKVMKWSKLVRGINVVAFSCMVVLLPEIVEARLRVVATTTILADTVQQIGHDKVTVRSLMGSNPHHYKIRTEDIRHLSQAHLVIYNGLSIENGLRRVLSQLPKDVYIVDVSDCLPKKKLRSSHQFDDHHSHPENSCGYHYDPHFWLNVNHWMVVVRQIEKSLKVIDSYQAHFYHMSSNKYLGQLNELDQYIRSQSEKIPTNFRFLVTSHNALGYFGQAYGFETDGLMGTEGEETSIANLRRLSYKIMDQKLTTIFWDNTTSRKSMQALQESILAKGHKVSLAGPILVGGVLDSRQTLQNCDKHNHSTYDGMMRHNVDTILVHLTPQQGRR